MSIKGTDYKHDAPRSIREIALSCKLFTVIFGFSTRWHQENKLRLNISTKEVVQHYMSYSDHYTQCVGMLFIYFYPLIESQKFCNFTNVFSLGLSQPDPFPFQTTKRFTF